MIEKPITFSKESFLFSIFGLVLPVSSALILFGIQYLLSKVGFECALAWKIIFIACTLSAIILPFIFGWYYHEYTVLQIKKVKRDYLIFNSILFISLTGAFEGNLSNANTLCYVSDGQNGLELIFAAWLSLPIIMLVGLVYKVVLAIKNE